jgi:hypothetical protein
VTKVVEPSLFSMVLVLVTVRAAGIGVAVGAVVMVGEVVGVVVVVAVSVVQPASASPMAKTALKSIAFLIVPPHK